MIHKAKSLSLAIAAIAALSVIAAPAAQATEFHAGAGPTIITGSTHPEQTAVFVFTDTKGNIGTFGNCASSLEGTSATKTFQELQVTATYGPGCQLFGVAASVRMNGCKYTIKNTTPTTSTTMLVDIIGCTASKKIEVQSAICRVTIGEQSGLSHLVFTQTEGPPKEVDTRAEVGGIVSTQDGMFCPDGNNETTANVGLFANITLKAFVDNGTSQVTKHSHQYTEHKCGAQVDLLVT